MPFSPKRKTLNIRQPETAAQVVAKIYSIYEQDKEYGTKLLGDFRALQQNRDSQFYNPYATATNKVHIDTLSSLGVDTSNINQKWFEQNADLQNYFKFSGDGTPVAPTKRSKPQEIAAYSYWKLAQDEERTQKAENEWSSLQRDVKYWAGRKDRNYSDDEVLSMIDWKKYPTLLEMDEAGARGAPVMLNRGIDISKDALKGLMWSARNGVDDMDPFQAAVQAELGQGEKYKDNPAIRSRRDPTSEYYNPYLLGSTLDEEAAYFGVPSFNRDWLNKNLNAIMGSNDETAKKYVQNVYDAVEKTESIASELEEFYGRFGHGGMNGIVTRAIRDKSTAKDAVLQYFDTFDMAGLKGLTESLDRRQPLKLAQGVNFDLNYITSLVDKEIQARTLREADSKAASEKEKQDALKENGDLTGADIVPPSKTDKSLTIGGIIVEGVSTFLLDMGGHDEPDGGGSGGSPLIQTYNPQTGSSTGLKDEPYTGGSFSIESLDDLRAQLAQAEAKLKDPRFSNPGRTDVEGNRALADTRVLVDDLKSRIARMEKVEDRKEQTAQYERGAELSTVEVPKDYEPQGNDALTAYYNNRKRGIETLAEKKTVSPMDVLMNTFPDLSINPVYYSMTDEELRRYAMLRETNAEDAEAYLKWVESNPEGLNAKYRAHNEQFAADLSRKHPLAASLLSTSINSYVAPAEAIGVFFKKLFTEDNLEQYDPGLNWTAVSGVIREVVPENFSEFGKFIYGTGMSIVDNLLSRGTFRSGTLAAMGLNASSSMMDKIMAEGGTEDQAVALGLVAGAVEGVTEHLQFERWTAALKSVGGSSAKSLLKNLFTMGIKSAFPEAMEEGVSDLANLAADIYVRGNQSDTIRSYQAYLETYLKDGLSPKDASISAWNDVANDTGNQILLSMAGGGLSGLFFGEIAAFSSNANARMNKSAAKDSFSKSTETSVVIGTAQVLNGYNAAERNTSEVKAYEAQTVETLGIDPAIVKEMGTRILGMKNASLFDVLERFKSPPKKFSMVRSLESVTKSLEKQDPITRAKSIGSLAKLNLIANTLKPQSAEANQKVEDALVTSINDLVAKQSELQTKMDAAKPAETKLPSYDASFSLQRWGQKGLVYINNLLTSGNKLAQEIAVKLQSMPQYAESVIVAETNMDSLNTTPEMLEKQAQAYARDMGEPDIVQNAEERAENQQVEIVKNEILSGLDVSPEVKAVETAQEEAAVFAKEVENANMELQAASEASDAAMEAAYADPMNKDAWKAADDAVDAVIKAKDNLTKIQENQAKSANKAAKLQSELDAKVQEAQKSAEEQARDAVRESKLAKIGYDYDGRAESEAAWRSQALKRKAEIESQNNPELQKNLSAIINRIRQLIPMYFDAESRYNAETDPEEKKALGNYWAEISIQYGDMIAELPNPPQYAISEPYFNDEFLNWQPWQNAESKIPLKSKPAKIETRLDSAETMEAQIVKTIEAQFADRPTEDIEKAKVLALDKYKAMKGVNAPVFNEQSAEFVKKAEAKFGIRFISDDTLKGSEEAYYDKATKTIHLNPQATQGDALTSVAMHELTHAAQSSDWYNQYKDLVLKMAYGDTNDNAQFQRDIDAKIARYANDGKTLSVDDAIAEIVAQQSRKVIFADAESVNKLVAENPTLAKRIYEAITRVLRELFGNDRQNDLYKAQSLLKRALTEQAKTASGEQLKMFSLDDGVLANPMYSKMARVIDDSKETKFSAQGLIPYLTNRGVKADEIRWSGIQTFLQGKKSVTKAELAEFARGNELRVEDATHGGKVALDIVGDKVVNASGETLAYIREEIDRWRLVHIIDGRKTFAGTYGTLEAARQELNFTKDYLEKRGAGIKFQGYALPGGTNYREVLFTVPDIDGTFQSAHWDEKNVLAHARLQDFETADGNPVLFVEEVQSDWHEKGREGGYETAELTAAIKASDEAHRAFDAAYRHQEKILKNPAGVTQEQFIQAMDAVEETRKKSEAADSRLREQRYVSPDGAVPPAPFTDTWHEYVLKRVLRMAAEGDYDYVAWTTGKMQADRYNLAKQVKSVGISARKNGQYFVNVYDNNDAPINAISKLYSKEEVVQTFGKDLGSRLIEKADKYGLGNITGEDLTIGGEGMKAFYDIGGKSSQNIPRFLSKYGAQWGAKVDNIELETSSADMMNREEAIIVPAINVTPGMKESVLYEGQPMYSLTDSDDADIDKILNQLISKYGAIPQGENATNTQLYPQKTSPGKKVRRFVRTVSESGQLNADQQSELKKGVVEEKFSYAPISDTSATNFSDSIFNRSGLEGLESTWLKALNPDSVPGKRLIAVGEKLLMEYSAAGDTENTMRLIGELSDVLTRAGQTVQAAQLLKKMTSAGQLMNLQRIAENLTQQFNGEMFELNEELVNKLMQAKTPEEIRAAAHALKVDLAEQIPPNWKTRFNSWRYLSMLGNPRTHIRNILGNLLFTPVVRLKDTIGAAIEKTFGTERTKSAFVNRNLYNEAMKDAYANREAIQGGGKYNPQDEIMQLRRNFGKSVLGRGLEGASRLNITALEAEDWFSLRRHYAHALGGYMQANNLTFETPDGEKAIAAYESKMAKARAYALEEAQKATFRDASETALLLNKMAKKGGVGGLLVEGIFPFKKTPINILKRGIEYSPIGLIDGLSRGIYQLKKGDITGAQFIDKISAGMTGTMIAVLGAFAASTGFIKVGFDDDKEDKFKGQTGHQEYALEVGGISVTLDWLTPSAMPLFVGATVYDSLANDFEDIAPEEKFKRVREALSGIMEPVFNLTMLDGVNDAIQAAKYNDSDPITAVFTNSVSNFAGQFVPTLAGQLSRTLDPIRRRTYTDKNSALSGETQRLLDGAQNKLSFLLPKNEPYVDLWGEFEVSGSPWLRAFENFLSPAYINELTPDAVEEMLLEVHRQTSDDAVLPGTASKYFQVNGNRVDLTSEQYTAYSVAKGKTQRELLEVALNDPAFQSLNARDKAIAIKDIYEYASQTGKKSVYPGYKVDGWIDTAKRNGNPFEAVMEQLAIKTLKSKREEYQSEFAKAIDTGNEEAMGVAFEALIESGAVEKPDNSYKKNKDWAIDVLENDIKALYLAAYDAGDEEKTEQLKTLMYVYGLTYDTDKWIMP